MAKTYYQIRIKDRMSNTPASDLMESYDLALAKLEEIRNEIRTTWATPDPEAAYIATIAK